MSKLFVAGHSLGAARAAIYAYYRLSQTLHVDGLYLFGCPNPGNRLIGKKLSSIPVLSYKNRRDLVTNIPVNIEFLNEEYVPVSPFLELNERAPKGDSWGIFSDHHSELYQKGINRLSGTWTSNLTITPIDAINAVVDMYNHTGTWSWTHFVNGEYCGIRNINGDKLVVFRGSTTALDWTNDIEVLQTTAYGARMSQGFLEGVTPVIPQMDYNVL